MTKQKHQIKWFVYSGGKKIRRESTMRGRWDYDVTCSCGWETNTGGAILSYMRFEVWYHKNIVAKVEEQMAQVEAK